MDFNLLPEAVKTQFNSINTHEPEFVLRGSGGLTANTGESYLVFSSETLYLFERSFGSNEFKMINVDLFDGNFDIDLKQERFSSLLIVGNYEMKLSSFEASAAAEMVKHVGEVREHRIEQQNMEPNPFIMLIMMLIELGIHSDPTKTLSNTSENFIVNDICGGSRILYNQGWRAYEEGRINEFLRALRLDNSQKRCMLANMMEMVMRDGEFSTEEQNSIDAAAEKLGIDAKEFQMVWDVILDKNCLSMLT